MVAIVKRIGSVRKLDMPQIDILSKRKPALIKALKRVLKPVFSRVFKLEVHGLEHLSAQTTLYVSNHNIGALIESHALLFEMDDKAGDHPIIYGFTHPSIFKIWGIKHYFEWLGSVPATYEVAQSVFQANQSLLIFPGGNKQALRPVWNYKENSFRDTHGWAKIAKQNNVDVVAITYKGSHFVNPVLFQSAWLSKILVFPWLCGLKWISVSIGQLLATFLAFAFLQTFQVPFLVTLPILVIVFSLTSLMIIFPSKISMTIHPRLKISEHSQDLLEDKVQNIMDSIYY